jgi:hypothetical protein
LNSPLHHCPLSSFPSFLGIVSTGIIFHFHSFVHSICTIFTHPHPLYLNFITSFEMNKAFYILRILFCSWVKILHASFKF